MRDSDYFRDPPRTLLPIAEQFCARYYEDAVHKTFWKNSVQEKYIRVRSWWSFNDAYRGNFADDFCLPPEQEMNLRSLLNLLDVSDPDASIMKAEVLRELGQFGACLSELDRTFGDRYVPVVDVIKRLAKSGKRQVEAID